MKTLQISAIFMVFGVFLANCQSESAENVQLTGSFRVAGAGEELPKSTGQEVEHPFFQLEGMKIARAYLDRQYAKERAQRAQQFGV